MPGAPGAPTAPVVIHSFEVSDIDPEQLSRKRGIAGGTQVGPTFKNSSLPDQHLARFAACLKQS